MAKFKNETGVELDFTILKKRYVVAPDEEVDIPADAESFVRSRGIKLTLAKGEAFSDAPGAERQTKGVRKVGNDPVPSPAPPFAGDVTSKPSDAPTKGVDVKVTK